MFGMRLSGLFEESQSPVCTVVSRVIAFCFVKSPQFENESQFGPESTGFNNRLIQGEMELFPPFAEA